MTEGAAVAHEVMAALERNGVSFVGLPGKKDAKTKDGSRGRGAGALQLPSTVRIDIPATNPGRTALKVWEELVNVLRKDGADPAAAFVHRKKVQHAEKNIRDAFMALHRGLELLKKFRYVCAPPASVTTTFDILLASYNCLGAMQPRLVRFHFVSWWG